MPKHKICGIERLAEILNELPDHDKDQLDFMRVKLKSIYDCTAERFHVSAEDLDAIMSGKLEVSHVVFRGRGRRLAIKRLAAWAIAALCVLLLLVPGLADGIRCSVFRVFGGADSGEADGAPSVLIGQRDGGSVPAKPDTGGGTG